MIRKEVLDVLGGYDEYYYFAADYDLITRIALLGRIEIYPKTLVEYRVHSGQISHVHYPEQVSFANSIRRNYYRAFISRYKSEYQSEPGKEVLLHLPMSRVIAMFVYARFKQDDFYQSQAESGLEWLLSNDLSDLPLCLNDGLLGIAVGCIYLLDEKFVAGDIDDILKEIDELLFAAIRELQTPSNVPWKDWLYYLRLRMSNSRGQENQLIETDLKHHSVHLLECLALSISEGLQLNDDIRQEIYYFHQLKLCPACILSKLKNNEIL